MQPVGERVVPGVACRRVREPNDRTVRAGRGPGQSPVPATRHLCDLPRSVTARLRGSSAGLGRRRQHRHRQRTWQRLHIMAIVQLRRETAGRACYRRKLAAGKSPLEALRCLKRRLSNVVYQQMVHDAKRIGTGPGGQAATWGATPTTSAGWHGLVQRVARLPARRRHRHAPPRVVAPAGHQLHARQHGSARSDHRQRSRPVHRRPRTGPRLHDWPNPSPSPSGPLSATTNLRRARLPPRGDRPPVPQLDTFGRSPSTASSRWHGSRQDDPPYHRRTRIARNVFHRLGRPSPSSRGK